MRYPYLSEIPTTREMISTFGGYNHNLRISDNEFYDMTNLTSDDFPVLSPRGKRGVYASPTSPQGMISKDKLCYVDGADFVIGDQKIEMGLSTDEKDCPKTLISMGSYVIVLPDKMWVNTVDYAFGDIDAHYRFEGDSSGASPVIITNCQLDGTEFSDDVAISSKEPQSPNDLDYWIDTSSIPHTLKQYSATSAMWVAVLTTYIKISSPGIGVDFKEGDSVRIHYLPYIEVFAHLFKPTIIQARGDDYIVVTGLLDRVHGYYAVAVTRQMPDMDFVIEAGNRLWGCRYGTSRGSTFVNEIYASKLGDFRNWDVLQGVSTDSYVASVGTDGPFTGAIAYLGHPIFFKENCIHKIYGNSPSNYQIQTTACRGVQKGSEKSLTIVNEYLYYKARTAVCCYDGSLPVEISSPLGGVAYHSAAAGAIGNKYYISMADEGGKYHLFVYDTQKGMWHREDNTQVAEFCNCLGELYYIDCADNKIKTVKGSGVLDTSKIAWEAVTGVIGTDSPDKKYISRIDVRMKLALGSRVVFFVQYDSNDEWKQLYSMEGTTLQTFAVPIRPHRCDHLRLKIVGEGDAKIYSICKTIEQGSDL